MKLLICGILFSSLLSVTAIAGTKVKMETNKGDIIIELNDAKAPITVKNFLKYADEGFYNGLIFHRIISGFMIQGGGFSKDMKQKKNHAPIKNEAYNGLTNDVGTIAMARTGVVDSATSQFFINVNNNASLNFRSKTQGGFGYAVFGKVIKGMPVVNKIKAVTTTVKNGMRDVPVEAVIIEKVTRL